MQVGQLVPMRLSAQTTISTMWPSPSDFSPSWPSEPGSGIFAQVSASTTKIPSETRSKDKTVNSLGISARARAASPHPRSAMTVLGGYVDRDEM